MSLLKGGLIFVSGAAIGTGITWFIMNRKLTIEMSSREDEIQKAVDQVKEAYHQSEKNQELKTADASINYKEETPEEVNKVIDGYNTLNVFETAKNYIPGGIQKITPEDYEANEESSHVSLTYFLKDDTVVYSTNLLPMDDPESYIGDFKGMFEGDEEVIYISNKDEGALYEVFLDAENSLAEEIEKEVDEDIVLSYEGGD